MAENSSEQGRPLTHFQPEVAYSPEKKGPQTIEIIADPVSGEILKSGDPRDVRLWVESEKSRAETLGQEPPKLEVVRGGLLTPGFVDAHYHPFIFSGLKLSEMENVSSAETKEDLIAALRKKSKTAENEKVIVGTDLNITRIRDLTADDLDKVSTDRKVVVYDPSYFGCVVNHLAMADVGRLAKEFQEKTGYQLRGELRADGYLNGWDWVRLTLEMIELEGGSEKLVEQVSKEFEDSLGRGVTALHDLELGTYNEVIAWLMLRQKLGEKIPVRQVYLQPATLKLVLSQIDDLRARGLVSGEEEIAKMAKAGVIGMKVYSDGSFAAHTALVSEPYLDAKTRGEVYHRMEQLNQALELAKKYGIENVAIHAIGDKGIQRAVDLAKRWARMAEKADFDPTKFRIEHFEMPTKESLQEVGDLGIWVTPQPNFLTDYQYTESLGNRVKLLCPHREILGYTENMMFGTDGMPPSALFGIWMATHAPEESQRLTFDEALLAYSLASGRYEGAKRGTLETGQKADIIVTDRKLEDILLSSAVIEDPREVPVDKAIDALESNIQKVYLRGELVHSRQ